MPELKSFPVFGEHGQIGNVLASSRFLDARSQKTIRLNDGQELSVSAEALEVQSDGSFRLKNAEALIRARNGAVATLVPPEQGRTNPEPARTNGAAAVPETLYQVPSDPLFQNGYSVETVAIDRVIDAPVEQRQEGDTLVFPVIEEVWVVEKKLYLREEIRVTPRKKPVEKIRTIEKR